MWQKPFRGFEEVKAFLIMLSLIIALFISLIFLGIYLRSNELLLAAVREEAMSYFALIVETRLWNARYGSVYVEKKEGVQTNPYLEEAGVGPDLACEGNRVLTMRNPALMTREISELMRGKSGVQFRITSKKPLNPANVPDSFEMKSLDAFEQGRVEAWLVDRGAGPPVFRYMAPLRVDRSCLPCHGRQGYREGDIRGGISISIPLTDVDDTMRRNRHMIIFLSVLTIVLLLVIVYVMAWKLVAKLRESQKQLRHMSITDELTGLRNRRSIMERLGEEFQRARREGRPLGLIMLDLDFFKQLNDTYGHLFGDMVLMNTASRIRPDIREYDLLGRIGGEEFLIVAPDSALQETIAIAERTMGRVRGEPFGDGEREVQVTISAGVTMLENGDPDIDALLSRADDALYAAKQQGRDRLSVL